MIVLSPAQQKAYETITAAIAAANISVLKGAACSGMTTILQRVAETNGGVLLGMGDWMRAIGAGEPFAIEEAFLHMMEQALATSDLVMVDDLHLITQVTDNCDYPRAYLFEAALTAVISHAAALNKKLVFATQSDIPWPVRRRAFTCEIDDFEPDDYASICSAVLREHGGRFDFKRVHRFAPALSVEQLRNACKWMMREEAMDTDSLIEFLRTHNMTSNVELEDVQRVTWSDLKGVDNVIRELETKIALPFENDALRQELGLKPKRGVLLAGPPGTGKTTIGRALAHRLKSKFFLIDGTMIAGSSDFYRKVGGVFDAAKQNAPSIVFIDDADVIFEDEDNRGFYRYLLTILDGLESTKTERVCVIMTAMHPGNLPASMLRSGRVELWLETSLPDTKARAEILRERLANLPAPLGEIDLMRVAAASQGLTGADLRNVVDDAKLLFASDHAAGAATGPVEKYFLEAIENVKANRRKYSTGRPAKLGDYRRFGFDVN